MPKKYKVLTFADFPLPSYAQRAHRAILFLDYALEKIDLAKIISPVTSDNFKNEHIRYVKKYFKLIDFKSNQYSIVFRLHSIFKLFAHLFKGRLCGDFKEIDIIRISNSYLILLARIIRNKNNVIIADCCDFYFDLYREFGMPFAKIMSPIIFYIEKYALQGVDLLFVDTPAQRDFLVNKMGFLKEKCIVSSNGVLLHNFPFLQEKDNPILEKYGFSKDDDTVLFYGGDISEMDGIEMILQFVTENEYVNGKKLKLLIIGKGNNDYIDTLRKYASDKNINTRVIFDSFKPYAELYKYLSVADVCLAPFRITATSNAVECGKIITYLLAGKKVLSTKADGVGGLYKDSISYFQDCDYSHFSNQLLELIQKQETEFDILQRRQLGEKFDFKKIIEHEYVVIDEYFKNKNQDFSKYDYL